MSKSIPAAIKLLKQNGISSKAIPPSTLVQTANQLNRSLSDTLNLIAFLRSSGQGYSAFPQTAKVLTGSYQ